MVKTMVSGVDFPLNQSIDLWIPIRHVPQVPWTASHRSVGTAEAVDAIVIPSCGLDIFSRVYPIYISYMYIYIHIMSNIIYIYICSLHIIIFPALFKTPTHPCTPPTRRARSVTAARLLGLATSKLEVAAKALGGHRKTP